MTTDFHGFVERDDAFHPISSSNPALNQWIEIDSSIELLSR
jgi:hypothetical protein